MYSDICLSTYTTVAYLWLTTLLLTILQVLHLSKLLRTQETEARFDDPSALEVDPCCEEHNTATVSDYPH